MGRRVYYDFYRHRIGDKVAMSAVLRWYRDQYPEEWIIAVDDFWFENGKQRSIPSSVIFGDLVNESVYSSIPSNAVCLDFGCIWIRVPWLARYGYYPCIKVDAEVERRLACRYEWMNEPYICIHVLEDAAYNRMRNHSVRHMAHLAKTLSDTGVQVVRVGQYSGYTWARQIDLTPDGLSVMETACIIKRCIGYIGGDTGISHIAAAVDVPWSAAIYGPPVEDAVWRRRARAMRCDGGFCSLPSIPECRRSIFYMTDHRFDVTEVANVCISRLESAARLS